jgi:hypothetical protein
MLLIRARGLVSFSLVQPPPPLNGHVSQLVLVLVPFTPLSPARKDLIYKVAPWPLVSKRGELELGGEKKTGLIMQVIRTRHALLTM